MSLFNVCRTLTSRAGRNVNSALKLQNLASKQSFAGQVTKNVGVAQDFTAITQRSFFSGSRCMNKYLTQGDQELAEFLEEEINLEKEAQVHTAMPRVKGFQTEITGSEVALTRQYDGELITVKFNINNTVEDETPPEMEEENPQDKDLKSKPKFQVDLSRKGQTLTFLCCFVEGEEPTPEQAEQEDAFEIEEFYIHDGSGDESPTQYVASAGIIDGDLYNLFMNMLDDRGISKDFANELIDLSTAHEHKLYIKTLEDIKKFLHSWESRDKEQEGQFAKFQGKSDLKSVDGGNEEEEEQEAMENSFFMLFDFILASFHLIPKNEETFALSIVLRVHSNDCVCEIHEKKKMIKNTSFWMKCCELKEKVV